MGLTPDQQQSVQDSGGYYDATGNWIDQSGDQQPQGQGGVNPWLGILAALGGAVGGRAIANNAASNNVPPELRQLLAQSVQRQTFQNPLFEAQTRGVYSMLPNFAREGTQMGPSMGNAPPQVQQASGGGMNPLLAAGLGAGGGAALMKLLGGNGPGSGGALPLQQIVDGIKKIFPHNQFGFTGNTQPGHGFGGPGTSTFEGGNPFGGNLPGYENYFFNDPTNGVGMTGLPSDPSGGTGVGPGMQNYYNSGGGGDSSGGEDVYGDE